MWLNNCFAFVFGTVIGSFLNVCILRLPQEESIVRPRSHCPSCGALIKAYDNIPIVSYLLLRGRCRACQTSISPLYPLVELLTGTFFVLCILKFSLSLETIKFLVLGSGLIVLVFSDLKFRLLPNEITLFGILAGLGFSCFVPIQDRSLQSFVVFLSYFFQRFDSWVPWAGSSFLNAVFGVLFGAGILFLVGEVYYRLRHVEGMGMGDVKMMGMVGAFLGLKLAFMTILMGSILGTVFGIALILLRQKDMQYELPFGTFLGASALLLSLYGLPILAFVFP
jgi:leader peptidase (prepilin peptidase)/N-methyltransferase